MLGAFLLLLVLAVALPLAAYLVRRRRDWSAFVTSESRPVAADDDTWATKGGVWVGQKAMSWPLARIEVSPRSVLIDTGGLITPRFLLLDREEADRVRVRRGVLGVGIHFERADRRADGVTFWVLARHEAEMALRDRGWLWKDQSSGGA